MRALIIFHSHFHIIRRTLKLSDIVHRENAWEAAARQYFALLLRVKLPKGKFGLPGQQFCPLRDYWTDWSKQQYCTPTLKISHSHTNTTYLLNLWVRIKGDSVTNYLSKSRIFAECTFKYIPKWFSDSILWIGLHPMAHHMQHYRFYKKTSYS